MLTMELFGVWLAVLLTLSIFSYLYDDNPFYKASEHLFVGISAGYLVALNFWSQVSDLEMFDLYYADDNKSSRE